MKTKEMILTFDYIAFEEFDTRSHKDQRFRVTRYTVSYRGEDGHGYRKAFESKNGTPEIPQRGTHKELNGAAYQWDAR